MDEVKKWTFYLMMLVAGFATGIGTIGLFPQMWLEFGLTGLMVHIVFLAILTYLAISETEVIMKSEYFFTEVYTKLTRKPGMIFAILTVGVMFLSYYTANVGLSLLAPVLGTGTLGRLIAKIIIIALIFVIISRAKEKTFLIMALGGLLFILLIFIITLISAVQIPRGPEYSDLAKRLLMFQPITWELVRAATDRAVYGVGLGIGFYIMLGSFINERFNAKTIIGGGVLIQLLMGLLSTISVVHILPLTGPEVTHNYIYGGEEGALAMLGVLPKALSNNPLILLLFFLGLFMAGLTSILPMAEVDLQILQSTMKMGRTKAAVYVMGIVLLLGILDSPPVVADMMLKATSTAILATAIFEMYPVIAGIRKPTQLQLITAAISGVIFAIGFIVQSLYDITLGGVYYASLVLALIVAALGIVGESVVPAPKKESLGE
ncbi:sodium-dependent transporter [Thermococcus sp.]